MIARSSDGVVTAPLDRPAAHAGVAGRTAPLARRVQNPGNGGKRIMNKRVQKKIAKRQAHHDAHSSEAHHNGQGAAEGGTETPIGALREALRKLEVSALQLVRVLISEVRRSATEAFAGASATFEQLKDKIAPQAERSIETH
jgi:hypothetical protein